MFQTKYNGAKVWQFCYVDSNGMNQHSGIYHMKYSAEKGMAEFMERFSESDVLEAFEQGKISGTHGQFRTGSELVEWLRKPKVKAIFEDDKAVSCVSINLHI